MSPESDNTNELTRLEESFRKRGANLTPSERALTAYMRDNLFFVPFETGASLAARVGVSEMTVIRFLRSLGYTNLKELKDSLRADLADRGQDLDSILNRFQIHPDELAGLQESLELELGAVINAYELVATERWQQIVGLLAQQRRVNVVGNQATQGIALDFASRLKYARPGISFIGDGEGVYVEALEGEPETTCLVLVDIAPYGRKCQQLARKARELDLPLIFVTDQLNHAAYELTDLVLQGQTHIKTFWDSTTGLTTILNLLIHSVATHLGLAAKERLRFMRELGEHFQEFESFL
jgi:DNA-binding MurR/RpiR family transcriptional regulator